MRLSESKIDSIIRKVVGKTLNEAAEYDDNDLEYWSIVSQADAAVDRLEREGNVSYGWKDVAEKMGFRLETLNDADLELMKDAIEQAMLDANDNYWSKDAEFENDFRNMKTESMLNDIVKESVKKVLNEIGDTPNGQRALGALGMRKALRGKYDARDKDCESNKVYNYAKNSRGGDNYDDRGQNDNPLYYDYADGAIEYMNAHPEELVASERRRRLGESELRDIVKSSIKETLLREWGEDKEKVTEESNQDVITLYDLLKELQTKLLGSNINKRFLPKPSYAGNWYKLGNIEMDEFGFPTFIVSNKKYYSSEDGPSHAERVVSALINKHNLNVGYNTNKFGDVNVYSKGRRWKVAEI